MEIQQYSANRQGMATDQRKVITLSDEEIDRLRDLDQTIEGTEKSCGKALRLGARHACGVGGERLECHGNMYNEW